MYTIQLKSLDKRQSANCQKKVYKRKQDNQKV